MKTRKATARKRIEHARYAIGSAKMAQTCVYSVGCLAACRRMDGNFFVAGTIRQTYTPAYTALAMAYSSDRRAAVRATVFALMLPLVSITDTVPDKSIPIM